MIHEKMAADLIHQAKNEGVQKIVVGAVIERQEKTVLLLERASDDFMGGLIELPSGTVDEGETLFEALAREIKEETNLEMTEVVSYLGAFDYLSGSLKKTRQFSFKVLVKEGNVSLSPEHQTFLEPFLNSDSFQNANMSPETRAIILKAY